MYILYVYCLFHRKGLQKWSSFKQFSRKLLFEWGVFFVFVWTFFVKLPVSVSRKYQPLRSSHHGKVILQSLKGRCLVACSVTSVAWKWWWWHDFQAVLRWALTCTKHAEHGFSHAGRVRGFFSILWMMTWFSQDFSTFVFERCMLDTKKITLDWCSGCQDDQAKVRRLDQAGDDHVKSTEIWRSPPGMYKTTKP